MYIFIFQGFGADPVDVAAHLKIVGESLSIIGMRLQEHRVRLIHSSRLGVFLAHLSTKC